MFALFRQIQLMRAVRRISALLRSHQQPRSRRRQVAAAGLLQSTDPGHEPARPSDGPPHQSFPRAGKSLRRNASATTAFASSTQPAGLGGPVALGEQQQPVPGSAVHIERDGPQPGQWSVCRHDGALLPLGGHDDFPNGHGVPRHPVRRPCTIGYPYPCGHRDRTVGRRHVPLRCVRRRRVGRVQFRQQLLHRSPGDGVGTQQLLGRPGDRLAGRDLRKRLCMVRHLELFRPQLRRIACLAELPGGGAPRVYAEGIVRAVRVAGPWRIELRLRPVWCQWSHEIRGRAERPCAVSGKLQRLRNPDRHQQKQGDLLQSGCRNDEICRGAVRHPCCRFCARARELRLGLASKTRPDEAVTGEVDAGRHRGEGAGRRIRVRLRPYGFPPSRE